MKINELNKEDLYNHMRASGEIHVGDSDSKAWQRAFELYHQSQGQKLGMDCNKCWQKVANWLKGIE